MKLPPLPTVSDIVRLYKLAARKRLSQNFLLDMNLTKKIVSSAGNIKGGHVCEVGPGPGGITRAILNKEVEHLHVIEKDKRFFPGLKMLADLSENMTLHHGDVLDFDMDNLFPEDIARPWHRAPPNIHIIGNLPFNVSTPLIIQYLQAISNRTGPWKYGRAKLTLTFQEEVGQRMVAEILTDQRCRLSVMCQHLCDVKLKFVIPGTAFVPAPKVNVAVVQFTPLKKPRIALPFKLVEKVCRHVFHYRNKKIKHCIATLFPKDMPELTKEMLTRADILESERCYKLTVEDVGSLCEVYSSICHRMPFIYKYDYRDARSLKDYKQNVLQQTVTVDDLPKLPCFNDETDIEDQKKSKAADDVEDWSLSGETDNMNWTSETDSVHLQTETVNTDLSSETGLLGNSTTTENDNSVAMDNANFLTENDWLETDSDLAEDSHNESSTAAGSGVAAATVNLSKELHQDLLSTPDDKETSSFSKK